MKSLLLGLPVALISGALAAQEAPTVPTRLALDVVAVGRDGAPVIDLKPDDFEVWISGYRIPVEEVAFMTPETSPRTIVLLLDNAAVGVDLAPRVKETARAFVSRMGSTDRISVIPVHGTRTDSV